MKNRFLQFNIAILVVLFFGCSTSSDGNGNSTTDVLPVAPTNLIGSVISPTQINLSWTDNSTNETGFKIERKSGTGIFTVVGTTSSNVTTYSDSGLTPSTTYIYRVYSYNTVGDSPTYSNEVTLTTNSQNSTAINVPGPNVTDIDGYVYQSVTICNQTWTKSNLNVSKYTDGTQIPQVTDPTQWVNLTTGAWCYYQNNTANGTTYGKLYNWYAVAGIYDSASAANLALRKKLAPTGWHVPTRLETSELINCLGGDIVAGGKMKETGITHWSNPNVDATNASGFTALPGGFRENTSGTFAAIQSAGFWWNSTEDLEFNYGHDFSLESNYGSVTAIFGTSKICGFSVRCIRD
jgi:uncharacterized protein (TIGR02145 family)